MAAVAPCRKNMMAALTPHTMGERMMKSDVTDAPPRRYNATAAALVAAKSAAPLATRMAPGVQAPRSAVNMVGDYEATHGTSPVDEAS